LAFQSKAQRIAIAERRILSILKKQTVATLRTLEQKISDAGPNPQRVEPFLISTARNNLVRKGVIRELQRAGGSRWYHLIAWPQPLVDQRLAELLPIHAATASGHFIPRLGQTLEIAVYKGLQQQTMPFLGAFTDLAEHDDSTLYKKEEPPATLSARPLPNNKRLDFLLISPTAGPVGLEVKNIREWMYPDRVEIRELFLKCCYFNAVPVLIARRIPYLTFSVVTRCGGIIHQNYNQLYPFADAPLAALASRKDLLGYHDIRVGNEPDYRLVHFLKTNLPNLLQTARAAFDKTKPILLEYAEGRMSYEAFKRAIPRSDSADEEEEE
jgi:hypothetical protein